MKISSSNDIIVLVPAFKPPGTLIDLVAQLPAGGAFRVIMVNDGSAPEYDALFASLSA